MRTEAQKKADKKYQKKLKQVKFFLYPSETDITQKLNEVPIKAEYIKNLIRQDIKKGE